MAFEFIFDTNKCTGCHACSVACIIENQVDIENNWRQIISYNVHHKPELASYHLSLACNHCDDPPCLKYCPALAYSKDIQTGSVVLNPDNCIGCKYCTWVCPYDAPKYNKSIGTVEKCTFCLHRLQKSKEPACVALCPTDALNVRERSEDKKYPKDIPGFRDYDISPGIDIIKLINERLKPEMHSTDFINEDIVALLENQQLKGKKKMNMRSEWTLLLLSIVFPFLVALSVLLIFQTSNNSLTPVIISCGIFSLGISTLHLGKKKRAYRAILNIKSSWLSREVIFFSLFLLSLTILHFFYPDSTLIKFVTVFLGILALFSMDQVYSVIPKTNHKHIHSAMVLFSAVYLYGILSLNLYVIGLIGGLRIFLYLSNEHNTFLVPILRLMAGYFIPTLLLALGFGYLQYFIVISVLFGELIDRYEFYQSIDIISPQRQMQIDEESNLNSRSFQSIRMDLCSR